MCFAESQPEVAKGIVLLGRLRAEKDWVAETIEEEAGNHFRAEVGQIRGCSEKK